MNGRVTVPEVAEALKTVTDPEIHQDIVGLGLIYGIGVSEDGRRVTVKMTVTTPYCPYLPQMIQQAKLAILTLPGVKEAEIEMVWEPPWDPKTMASDEVRDGLGLW
jgi:metal-sulfur cluster biosynthetic enzyme